MAHSHWDRYGYEPLTDYWEQLVAHLYQLEPLDTLISHIDRLWDDAIARGYEYVTELVMCVNHLSWEYYAFGLTSLSEYCAERYYQMRDYVLEHFQGKDLAYYLEVTD